MNPFVAAVMRLLATSRPGRPSDMANRPSSQPPVPQGDVKRESPRRHPQREEE